MSSKFIKDSYLSLISGVKVDNSSLEQVFAFNRNSFILKHNIEAVSKFVKFLKSSENIFILNGFMGAGKSVLAESFIEFVDENVLVFKNTYQESINLDDVLLSLFKDFSVYHNEKKIVLPKVESSIFSDKINTYIKSCNSPMLFIFDSFEISTRSKESQRDILSFINFLSHFERIKIVICSRSFKENNLISADNVISHSLSSLSIEELYQYLSENLIKGSKYEMDELYKATRGHFLLLELSVLIMGVLNISLTTFSSEYKKSTRNFLDFLISKILSVTSEKFIKLLILLCAIRHGLSAEFIIKEEIATLDDIDFLLNKRVIYEKFNLYQIKDYVKNEYLKSINAETKIKVHEYLINLYNSELPLKPFERKLFLSRQTMRQEISYHEKKIEVLQEELAKTGKSKLGEMQDFTYLSYSKTSGYEKNAQESKSKRYIKNIITKPSDKRARFELSNEDSILLHSGGSKDAVSEEMRKIVSFQNKQDFNLKQESKQEEEMKVPETIEDYLELAQNAENNFNFSGAILYYKKALTYKNDNLYSVKEPIIYTKLALCYKKVQDTDTAINMYEKVYQLYLKESVDKANSILLCIAQIYNEIYKFDKAKEVYNRILNSNGGASAEIAVRVYLDLSELEDNNLDSSSAINYARKALNEAEKQSDLKLLSECYFKYALLLDDSGDFDLAQKYYLRCIQLSDNVEENMYLASAYSNLAGLSADRDDIQNAKMYYELSTEIDKKLNNHEGLYYSYSKLAELYKDESPEKKYEYLVKALSSAKRFDDISYAVSVYFEIGCYYIDIQDYKRALKSFILAKTLAPQHGADDIQSKLDFGINKVKVILGDIEFVKLMNEIKKKR